MDKVELRAALVTAFPPKTITKDIIKDCQGAWEEYDNTSHFEFNVVNKTWQSLDKNFLGLHENALIYLGETAFRALQPAYLLYLIDNDDYGGIQYCVATVLTQKDDPLQLKTFKQRIKELTDLQQTVVKNILLYLAQGHRKDIMIMALESYW